MSVFDGEIEFQSVYMVDYAKKVKPKSPRRKAVDDNCLIVGLSRAALKPKDVPRHSPDVLCPLDHEYYKKAVEREPQELLTGRELRSCNSRCAALDQSTAPEDAPWRGETRVWYRWWCARSLASIVSSACAYFLRAGGRCMRTASKLDKRFAEDHPKLTKIYMSKDIDPTPIENEVQDLKRTEYLCKYCSRKLPFMSVNLARRARALQTLRLPDDIEIPDTSQRGSYRPPAKEKYKDPPTALSMRPKFDNSLQMELRRILRVGTGETTYGVCHGLLGQVVLEKNPFGPPRQEPKYGRWRDPYIYTYWL